jgi:hypothetical protein
MTARHRSPATARASAGNLRPRRSEGWSGRRGSNPRPTAWKAVTLPLSYSRLLLPPLPLHSANTYKRIASAGLPSEALNRQLAAHLRSEAASVASFAHIGAKDGGEARIRTLVATGATDLQSVAIDRSATSPNFLWIPCVFPCPAAISPHQPPAGDPLIALSFVELAKGFEPPTG